MSWFNHGKSRIYYEESGSGDPLLLLPGITDSIGKHVLLRTTLAQRYRVIAADLPGSGRSGPQPRRYHVGYYEEDAHSFTALLQERDAAPAHLVGFSDGGELALLMAALTPQIARTVLTWGAAGVIHDPDGLMISAFRRVIDDPEPGWSEYREYLISAYGEETARATTRSFADTWDNILAAGGDLSLGKADKITCPALLIFGERDFVISKAIAEDLAGRIRMSETIEAEGAGHGLHEERPEWFVKTVTEWLAKQ
jgi:valacyclovir hydrolase